jgi:hypothetical protein
MTQNPFYNAFLAIAYIVSLVSTAILIPKVFGGPEESIIYPMLGLSVFVLSAALMTFFFFYQPVVMLLDGKREEAVKLFLQTVGVFAIGTAVLLLVSFFFRA